jgi:protein gp37
MTKIEWADKTWNVTVGCSRVSPGCDRCYAISQAHRAMQPAHRGLTVHTEDGTDWTGEVRCLPERLDVPLKVRKPTRWFVDSMSDLFHPDVSNYFIAEVFARTLVTPQHAYLVLTKRPHRMAGLLNDPKFDGEVGYLVDDWIDDRKPGIDPMPHLDAEARVDAGRALYPNVWLGTSIESDRYSWRAEGVRETPAAVRWLSLEPLLGPLPSLDLTDIDWVVTGGESGPGARPCDPDWVRDIRDRCIDAGTAYFHKQWGGRTAKAGGRELDGRTWDQYPEAAA